MRKNLRFLLLMLVTLGVQQASAQVVINEVDANQTGTDIAEFVELYGAPNTSLDGLVLVFFNGALQNNVDNGSYAAYDLDGYSTDANGFFVIGNSGVNGVQMVFASNGIQNGADAVALYTGNAADFPNGTVANGTNLIDALVYDAQTTTPSGVDQGLLDALTPGETQVDENANLTFATVSMSRIPDGGLPFDLSSYVMQAPTPGATNVSVVTSCDGGTVAASVGASITVCLDSDNLAVDFSNTNATAPTNYWYVITDASGNIVAISEVASIDFDAYGFSQGTYLVWGLALDGAIDGTTATPGLPATGITATNCASLSQNSIAIDATLCLVPTCDGGTVSTLEPVTSTVVCIDDVADVIEFTSNSTATDLSYVFLLTDEANNNLQLLLGSQIDANTLAEGTYRVWGISFDGQLDPFSTTPGLPATGIVSDGSCLELSSNFVTLTVLNCNTGEGCQELFFSEYIEGSSNNKLIEIFNPTNFTVNLSEYSVNIYSNGSVDISNTIALNGQLEPFGTYIIANSQAAAELIAAADTLSNVTNFNGDDALELMRNNVGIDVFGTIGNDPGTQWSVGTGSSVNNTLRRKPTVTAGTTNWVLGATQWDVFAQDDFTDVGNHQFVPCDPTPLIGFTVSGEIVEENVGTAVATVQAYNILTPVTLVVNLADANAVADEDFVNVFPITLNFPAGTSTQTVEVPIIDDTVEEDLAEYFTFTLSSETAVNYTFQSHTITIASSDQSFPVYTIASIKGQDEFGIMDSVGVFCEIRGVVHGINFNAQGTHFTLIDPTDGIKVFSALQNFGYTVNEGDSVRVGGMVGQFLGQAQLEPDYIIFESADNNLYPIQSVATPLTESMESHLVRVSCVRLVDGAVWQTNNGGFYTDVTDGINVYSMRIDEDAAFFGMPAFQGSFTLVGIVEQADLLDPYDTGYSIWPRTMSDFENIVTANFDSFNTLDYGDNGATVAFNNTSTGAVSYEWDFADGTTSTEGLPTHNYDFAWLNANPVFNITLTATGIDGCVDEFSVEVVPVYNSVFEQQSIEVSAYPNPTVDLLNIVSARAGAEFVVFDAQGKLVTRGKMTGNRQVLSTAGWADGLYHVMVQSESASGKLTIVKLAE